MARAETVTLLPLDRYSELMRIHPSHFNQLSGTKAPLSSGCDDIWDQDAREDLAWTMAQAEQLIADALGFYPAPKYITSEEVPFGLVGVRSDWRNAEVRTRYSYVDCLGTETLTLAQASAGVEYTDADDDPLEREEQARIGTAIYADLPACALPCDVRVFFRVADGAEDAADPRWEIRPIKVDIDGTTMRITAESSLFVRPDLWDLTKADCAGSDDPNKWKWPFQTANLVSAVDVYCRSTSKRTPVTLYWDGVCECSGICQHSTQTACGLSTDLRRGYFVPRPATWNGTTNVEDTPTYSQAPFKVYVSYLSGYPLDSRTCRMNANLERAIVKLTNVMLPKPPCGFCDEAHTRWENDRRPVDPLTPEAAGMPWDIYAEGALEAWRIVKRLARGQGGTLGHM